MRFLLQKMTALTCLGALLLALGSNAFAEEKQATLIPPKLQQQSVELRTVYKYSLLPGIRLCDPDNEQQKASTRVNCQSPELINSISTRDRRSYALEHSTIVHENVAPNGNILRIDFSRKAFRKN